MLNEVKGLLARFGRREAASPVQVDRARVVNRFHAVSIVLGEQACDAAKARAGTRFLSREAPRLPLAECGNPDCSCRYQHHDDRRQYSRRIADNRDAPPPAPFSGAERRSRSSGGRRIRD